MTTPADAAGNQPGTDEAAAAAAAQAAAAPAAPAQLSAAAAPAAPDHPADGVVVEYNPTGDTGLDLALAFIGQRGYGPEHPAIQAAMKGDFDKIEASLKGLGDKAKGYERYVAAGRAAFAARTAANEKAAEATKAIAVEVAGSVERWNAVHAWAVKLASDEEKAQIDAGLRAGGAAARAQVKYLSDLYAQSGEDKAPAKSPLKKGASGAAPNSEALSQADYIAAVRDLRKKYGNRVDEQPEYKQLQARRQATLRQGA